MPVGYALDLGTTTIEGSLVDLASGERLARGSRRNPQAARGADVMTRLTLAMRSRDAARAMGAAALEAAGELLRTLCHGAAVPVDSVSGCVLVGNTAMHHLALGLDAGGLAVAPYLPVSRGAMAVELAGLPPVYAAPLVAGYVGSDAVAGALYTGLAGGPTRMLLDVGTNTEVVLRHSGVLYAASAPAGPAFEGGEISCGMLAVIGAIDSVTFMSDDLDIHTVGDVDAKGICGSGLIDVVEALLRTGALDESGRLHARGVFSRWVIPGGNGEPAGIAIAPNVILSQKDVRAFQLAKGAVRAAIAVLLRTARAIPWDLEEVLLAGSFGSAVSPANVVRTSMLPPVPECRVKAVGNAALAGAEMMVRSSRSREAAERIAGAARHIELSSDPHFQEEFLRSLDFHMAMPQGTR